LDFVAFDFETANAKRISACEIGMVRVENDVVVDRYSSLIKPPPKYDYFSDFNVKLHGISALDVADAPSFLDVWGDIKNFFGNLPLVAHNVDFDLSVLRRNADFYDINLPNNPCFCTNKISRKILNLPYSKLDYVTDYLGIDFQHTHRGTPDAEAAAAIAITLAKNNQSGSLFELAEQANSPIRILNEYSFSEPGKSSGIVFNRQGANEYAARLGESDFQFNPELIGKEVIFTGKFASMEQLEAQKLVIRAGGTSGENVTKNTSYLVFGQWEAANLKPGETKSSKFRKAESYFAKGQEIYIIDEITFLNLLESQ
jgi:DNA polymerase-3 subunit epsilon